MENTRDYYIGFGKYTCQLTLGKNNSSCYYHYCRGDEHIVMICRTDDNSMVCLGINNSMKVISENESEKRVVKQLSEDGSRWEGDWYNQQPFGFGSLFDGEGNKIYSGFMFEGKKVGFGTEYFADNHKVDYCGNFMNDKRHGWGVSYDRNGQKMYEGEWACGNNHYQQLTIEDNYPSNLIEIHNSMKEFIIGEGCFNNVRDDLEIYNYPNLEKIIVKKDSFRLLNAFRVFNNERLTEIEIEGGNEERNGKGAFYEVNEVVISSSSHFLLLLSRSS